MSDVVIKAENLCKRYLVGHQGRERERYTALRDVIARGARSFARKAADFFAGRQIVQGEEVEEFWALKDISFEVKRGEVLGIIGRNGAGKSTLLKILSRITEPSAGRVTIKGRVASLLEVGTGFHPELTGRENIYLNGAILGMTRAEIRRKFDEIVDFAGVEKFLDTPLKHYSSGMYVRLAFAVAAHLEPEILLIDEVLAVGDAEFQKKCLAKMGEFAGQGRTVLFVSHNIGVIQELCHTCLLLSHGRIQIHTVARDAIALYLRRHSDVALPAAYVGEHVTISQLELADAETGLSDNTFRKDSTIEISVTVTAHCDQPSLHVGYALYSDSNRPLWWCFSGDRTGVIGLRKGTHRLFSRIPSHLLNDGDYMIEILAAHHQKGWVLTPTHRDLSTTFSISGGALGSSLVSGTTRPGFLMPVFDWRLEDENTRSVRV